jgi:hypothetical protein
MMKLLKSLMSKISEQLWLFALLTPILVFLGFGLIKWQAQPTGTQSSQSAGSVVANWKTEISSVEVAKIVAKPLNELLAMEIYNDALASETVAALDATEVYLNGNSNRLFTTGRRNSSVSLAVYQARNKNVL